MDLDTLFKDTETSVSINKTQSQPIGAAEWLARFRKKWTGSDVSDRISIDKVAYVNSYTHATFTCSKHGDFSSTPNLLMTRGGCPKCVNKSQKITTEVFIKRAKKVHGNLYDYSKTKYVGMNELVNINCRAHGEFHVRAANHVHPNFTTSDKPYYSGCQKCSTSLRFKESDPENLVKQIQKEQKYNIDRFELKMSGKEAIDDLLNEAVTTCVYLIQRDELVLTDAAKIAFATQFTSKMANLAIDIVTEPLAIEEEFLKYVIDNTMERIVFLGDKFSYRGMSLVTNKISKLDKVKESLWRIIDAAQVRLDNDNKQVCVTRKQASSIV